MKKWSSPHKLNQLTHSLCHTILTIDNEGEALGLFQINLEKLRRITLPAGNDNEALAPYHQPLKRDEDYTGAQVKVFEKALTTPPEWITYTNMVGNKNDMTSMAQKLVEMKLWAKVPDNIYSDYFDMRFVKKAE